MYKVIKKNRYLLWQLIQKDFSQKYKGSILGILWSVLVPLFMLAIYTFVFSEVFETRWETGNSDRYQFALVMFCGLSIFNMVSEVMNRSTTLISSHVNYVKKVIFPLELLPVVITTTAFFSCVISYGVLLVGELILYHYIPWTVWKILFNFIPLFILNVGISLLISAISVYLKDIANAISIIVMALMYLSPVFYSLEAVPENFRVICELNPLTYMIENARRVVLYGQNLDISYFLRAVIAAVIMYGIGKVVFDRTREGFADVL